MIPIDINGIDREEVHFEESIKPNLLLKVKPMENTQMPIKNMILPSFEYILIFLIRP